MSAKNNTGKVFRNFSYLTIGRILGDLFTFLLFIVIARVYGQDGLGEYSFAVAFAGFFVVFVDYGLTNYSIKELSNVDAFKGDHYGGILSIRLILSVLICILLILILPFLPIEGNKEIILLIGFSQVLLIIVESLTAALIARQDSHLVGITDFIYKFISSAAVVIPALLGQSLVFSLSMLPVTGVVYLLCVYLLVSRKYGRPKILVNINYYINTLKEAFTYALFMLLHQISTRTDVIIIGFLLGASSVGIYNAAYRIIFLLMLFAYFCELALMPVATNLFQNSREELINLYNQSFSIIMLIAIPISAGIWLISEDIISLIFGDEFIESSLILGMLAWLILLAFMKSIIGVFLTSCNMQKHRTRGQWLAAIINLSGTLLLIPLLGLKGAAIATIMSEIVLVTLNGVKLKQVLGIPKIHRHIYMGVIGSVAFCAVILSIDPLHLLITIPLSAFIFLCVLMLFKDFRNNEFLLIRKLVNKS